MGEEQENEEGEKKEELCVGCCLMTLFHISVSPSFFIQAWDWHIQSAHSDGVVSPRRPCILFCLFVFLSYSFPV